MGRAGTIARRSFLIGSAAMAGGVAFGVYAVQKPHPNPLLAAAETGQAVFNPWVMVSAGKITLITPHTDVGQGARAVQAALIAEEMDLDFGQFEVSPGVPDAAYFNTALAHEAVPFLSTDQSLPAEVLRGAVGAVIKLMGVQITGGSTTVPDSFDKLRMAGAIARETLKAAAAEKTGVPLADLKTAQGAVILPDKSRINYTDLAVIAATLAPARGVVLRPPEQWRLIGKPMQRLDILAKSTGTQSYGIDLWMDGMVHATVKTNPRRGVMIGHDATDAEKMRGVIRVLPVTNGVAVVADNTWRAFQAADAIVFDWGPAPYPAEQAAHWAVLEAAFTRQNLDRKWRDDGNAKAAIAEAGDRAISLEYRAPYVAHQPLEPLSAVVRVGEGRVDVWAGSQVPRFAQDRVAAITGQDPANVHLHNQYVGGSFGHRLEMENIALAAEIAAQMKGAPVKLTYRREEDFAQDFPRQIGIGRAVGVVRDGKVDTLDLQIATPSAARSQAERLGQSVPGPDGQIAAGAWNQPYALPNFRVRAYAVPGLAPVSSWRSVGASTAGFFAECALDELIHAAGGDPMAERLRLMNDDVARKVLEAVAKMSDWGRALGPNRGRGVAFVHSFGVPTAEVIEVTRTDLGIRIDKVFVAADVGVVVDPINFDNQVKGAVVWGLGHAMNAEITYADGMVEQTNYDSHPGMRMDQCPEITVRGLQIGTSVRGIGEPPVPPAAPALANAIFAATGQRIREMPFNKHIDFA
ncbi:molybdopterin cofactor-binding domain-containing protein [Phaeovulum sp.]|uniref:xanthine dehydrogenase family protein molybdopterin-binding subunit n=1 Tax=Phaeovulum sp. TaxID=2934796 RepID=UPI0039E46D18